MEEEIKKMIQEGIETNQQVKNLCREIEQSANLITGAFKNNRKILLAGNGGSASQASHIAAEFVGRFKLERKALAAIALNTDASILTAWSNDYGYDAVFERQIEALAQKGDVLILLSTSGNSTNLIKALEAAKKSEVKIISLLGKGGGKIRGKSDVEIIIPSDNTPRIQESHLMVLHIICELVDEKLFGE